MNRPLVVGIVGGVIVATAIALTFHVDRGPGDPAREPPSPSPPATGAGAPPLAAPPAVEKPTAPSFDIVRINPQGDAVIAGRAAPNAEVSIRDAGHEIGRVTADPRGEWVLVPREPLAPGSRELSLAAQTPGGGTVGSQDNVVVVVPERGKDIAGQAASGDRSGALALRVPAGPGGMGSTVLQKPGGDALPPVAPAAVPPPAAGAPPPPAAGAPAEVLPLALDAVDYDDAGKVVLSGRAPEGARVHVYLDNRLIGDGVAGADGIWRVAPPQAVAPGLYTLRIDQVEAGGKVVSRVETRFVRAKPLGDVPRDAVVFVQPGNSLWRLARNAYGEGVRYTVIYEANRAQIRDPDLIYPGQVFVVPRALSPRSSSTAP